MTQELLPLNNSNQQIFDEEQKQCQECKALQRLIELLRKHYTKCVIEHDDETQIIQYLNSNNYNLQDICNDFNHLLSDHNSNVEFDTIYNKLYENINQVCDYRHCNIYSRHNARRRYDDHLTIYSKPIVSDIFFIQFLDKMHSFYYHSYDIHLRYKSNELSQHQYPNNSDDEINANNDNKMYNKFSSTLSINNEHKFNNIYSFGQRFQYEESKKNEKWFVSPKYDSLKTELIGNKEISITIKRYDMEYKKCMEYMETKQFKILETRNEKFQILLQYMLSLLIYCNCTKYQNVWSATFRRIPFTETDLSLKKRHSYFYHVSKYLRYLIENFGDNLVDDHNKNKQFYHGVNEKLYFTRTVTQFNGPLSTSSEAAVAIRFSTNIGILLELQYAFSIYPLKSKFIDCIYFSDFTEEKECLFCGGIPIMIITNIINMSDIKNGDKCRKYINALNIINGVLNGEFKYYPVNIHSDAINLCYLLLSYQLIAGYHKDLSIPDYIINLLAEYCNHLKHIMIFWDDLNRMKKLKTLFCDDDEKQMILSHHESNSKIKNKLEFFSLKILKNLFPNLEQIEYSNDETDQEKDIINYIVSDDTKFKHLEYIIIHRGKSFSLSKYKNNMKKKNWNIYQDTDRIILYNSQNEFCLDSIDVRLDKIYQGATTNTLLQNQM